jgi:hypothetical protein
MLSREVLTKAVGGTRILLSRSFIGWRENDRKSSLISPVRVYLKSRNNPGIRQNCPSGAARKLSGHLDTLCRKMASAKLLQQLRTEAR